MGAGARDATPEWWGPARPWFASLGGALMHRALPRGADPGPGTLLPPLAAGRPWGAEALP